MYGWGHNQVAGFAKDASVVYFNGSVVKNAKPDFFVSLGNCYGRDNSSVFYERFRLNGADPTRCAYLGGYYSRDDNRVFFKNRVVKNANIDLFEQIDPFDSEFAYDGTMFYDRGEPVTQMYYVECLKGLASYAKQGASLVESGEWQRNKFQTNWHYRAPDEVLAAYDRVSIGDRLEAVVKSLGEGEPVSQEHLSFYFPPLDKMIRSGFSKGAGSVPWATGECNIPFGAKTLRWLHFEKVLAVAFYNEEVVALVILESDQATPSL